VEQNKNKNVPDARDKECLRIALLIAQTRHDEGALGSSSAGILPKVRDDVATGAWATRPFVWCAVLMA
jgi:hypothetical protein